MQLFTSNSSRTRCRRCFVCFFMACSCSIGTMVPSPPAAWQARYQDFNLDRLDFVLLGCLVVVACGSLVFQLPGSVRHVPK